MNFNISQIQVTPAHGLFRTLKEMDFIEQKAFENTHFVSWVHSFFSSKCQSCIPGKIWKYMREIFSYLPDDPFDEVIRAPYLMPDLRTGDCDDFSLFAKTVIDILGGFNTNYILFAKEQNKFSHIAVLCYRGTYQNTMIDPVVIDGANKEFNSIPSKYKFYKII